MTDLQPGPYDAVMGTGRKRVKDPRKLLEPMVAEVFKNLRARVGEIPGITYDLKCDRDGRWVEFTFKSDGTYVVWVWQRHVHVAANTKWKLKVS